MYTASKFAVTALTEGLRRELVKLNSKIRVTSISPGAVETEFVEAAQLTAVDTAKIPLLASKDIADAVLFAIAAPPHVQIHEMIVKPVGEKM
ncbi:Farnesol dehydrogenase [Blattella germanica]|nr:Farnesol dehydrogenase [Blattella germanica]